MKNTTFVFLLIIANSVVALQWPSLTTSMYILNSQGFKYSNFASLNIEAIHISGDNTNIYSIGEGKISGVNSLMVYKMDHNFNIQWNIWVPGLITHEGSDLSIDESSILLVINSSTQWVVWSIRSLDGNVNLLTSIQGVKDCQSLKINGDKAYISGAFSSNSIVIMLNSIDLSIVKSYTHTSDNVSFVYPYSTSSSNNNVLLGSSSNPGLLLTPAAYQITSIDMSLASGAKNWAIKGTEVCLLSCPSANLPILSLINESLGRSHHLLLGNSVPYFFTLNLSTGSLVGSVYKPSFSQTGIDVRHMSYSESKQTVFIVLYFTSGFDIISYDEVAGTFGPAYKSSAYLISVVEARSDFYFYGGQLLSNQYAFITDIYGENAYSQNPSFSVSTFAGSFQTTGSLNIGNDNSISVTLISGLVISSPSASFSNAGK